MQNFQVRGDLVLRDDVWALVPHKLVAGLEAPSSRLELVRARPAVFAVFRKMKRCWWLTIMSH